MNFSTVPPCRSTISRISSKYRPIVRRIASGSSRSPSAVDPVTSQKTTVTVLRTSRRPAGAASSAPHAPQKRNPSGFSWPHAWQIGTSGG